MAGPSLVTPVINKAAESLQTATGSLSSLNTQTVTGNQTATSLTSIPTLGLGVGNGLASLLLPGNFSPSMKSIFAAAVELPIITALVSPSWSRNAFYSVGGIAAGIYAGILLSQSSNLAQGNQSSRTQ